MKSGAAAIHTRYVSTVVFPPHLRGAISVRRAHRILMPSQCLGGEHSSSQAPGKQVTSAAKWDNPWGQVSCSKQNMFWMQKKKTTAKEPYGVFSYLFSFPLLTN